MEIDQITSSIVFTTFSDPNDSDNSDTEIILSMQTIFRIDEIEEIEGALWKVTLSSVADQDEQLQSIHGKLREQVKTLSGLPAFGDLLFQLKRFDEAYEL